MPTTPSGVGTAEVGFIDIIMPTAPTSTACLYDIIKPTYVPTTPSGVGTAEVGFIDIIMPAAPTSTACLYDIIKPTVYANYA